MSSSKSCTAMTSSASKIITTTPLTSAFPLLKPTWTGKPAFEHSSPTREDFNDTGDNWSSNDWAISDPFRDPSSLSPSPTNPGFTNNISWGTGPPVEIPTYNTHYTVLDSMAQQSGYTHYLLLSNRGFLFHGHQPTTSWTQITRINGDVSEFASLPELLPIPADLLFPPYRAFMTRFSGTENNEGVYMKKQPILSRTKYQNNHHARCTQQEVLRCERISAAPHRNLAKYLGVETKLVGEEERVVRIAYQRYSMDLHTFVLGKRYLRHQHVPLLMRGIERGMRHLHGLGLVHCDLRPMNVFVTVGEERDGNGDVVLEEVVVGDFDASVEIGGEVVLKRACGEWWPAGAEWGTKAETWIDEWCLEKMGRWLKEDGLGEWDFGAENGEPAVGSDNVLAGDIVATIPSRECW